MTYGVAAGAYLFVAAAVLYWKGTGCRERLQPGHWLAFEGVVQWVMSTIMWLLLLSSEGSRFGLIQSVVALRMLMGLILFAGLAWLAIRRQEPPRWRWTFAVMALAPIAAWMFTVTTGLTSWFTNQMLSVLIPTAAAAGVQWLVLLAAMAGDLRSGTERHWSHCVGAGMRLMVLAASAGTYTYYCLFPQVLMAQ